MEYKLDENGNIVIKPAELERIIKSLPSDDSEEHLSLFNGDKVLIDHKYPAAMKFDEELGDWSIRFENFEDAESLGLDFQTVGYTYFVDEGYGKIYKA